MILKVLIADDDLNTARYLKMVIEELVEVEVVAIAGNGREAVSLVKQEHPHTVILDIDMPEINGVDAAREMVEIHPGINLIFATAHPDYALEAFELYSVDYLLKPVDEKRLQRTIRRIQDKVSREQREVLRHDPGLLIQDGERKVNIKPEEILFIESRDHKVWIKTEKGEFLMRGDLNMLEQKLSDYKFFRSHRGFLVNLKMIKEIVSSKRTFEIVLRTGDRVLLSREREKFLREILG